MGSFLNRLTAFGVVLFAAQVGCGGGTVLVESTPRPGPPPKVDAPPPPDNQLNIPVPTSQWTPMTIGQGQGKMLSEVIAARKTLAILLEQNSSVPTLGDQVYEMVKTVAPEIQVVMRNRATMDWLMKERGELPYKTTLQHGGTDLLGQPYYLPREHPLNTEWLAKTEAMKGAEAVLIIGELRWIDDAMLRRLREGRRGGCSGLEAELKSSMDQMHEFFSPYKAAVDQALANAFARHLEVALPFWQDEIRGALGREETSRSAVRCLQAFGSLLDSFEPCLQGQCKVGPELHLSGGGIIGMVDEAVFVPDDCPVEGERDYKAELGDLASRAVSEVLSALDGQWAGDLMRSGALQVAADGMKEVCAPRHRRISPQDLLTARAEVAKFLSGLNEVEAIGRWDLAQGQERVSGLGPVSVLARVSAAGRPLDVDAHQLLEQIRRFDQCDHEGEIILRVLLVDVGSSEVLFSGLFFKEELLCNGLDPRLP